MIQQKFEAMEKSLREKLTALENKMVEKMTEKAKKECDKIKTKIGMKFNESINFMEEVMKDKMAELHEHAKNNEQHSRKSSLRVFGIPEVEGEDSQSQVIDFFNNVLKAEIKPEDIDITHHIGRRDRDVQAVSQSAPNRCRSRPKVLVMRNKKDLKDTGYSIAEDLAPQIYKRLKKIKDPATISKCWSVDGKIKYVKNGETAVKIIKNERDVEALLAGD